MPRRKLTPEERELSKQNRREKIRLYQKKYAATEKGKTKRLENRKKQMVSENMELEKTCKKVRYSEEESKQIRREKKRLAQRKYAATEKGKSVDLAKKRKKREKEKQQRARDTYGYKEMIECDLRRWKKAGLDHSGSLNKIEFRDFVHSEESIHMKDVIVTKTMGDIDRNTDGKISLEEYIGDMYNDPDSDVESEPSWIQSEKEQFINFRDKDKSDFMEFNEVRNSEAD